MLRGPIVALLLLTVAVAGCAHAPPGKDYHGGGRCVSMCEEMKPDARKAWAATVCKDEGGGDD